MLGILFTLVYQQACEQLNAWLGGFQYVLNRMTPTNFNWFLHTMLFLHTQKIIKQQQPTQNDDDDSDSDDDSEDLGIDIDVIE